MATTFAVPDGRVAMAATLYTGNATAGTNISNAVNAVGMQPDFVWIKNRTGANNHILTDSVRGVTKTLFSDATSAEATVAGALTAFNSGGFQIGYDGTAIVNATSNNYVGWQWKAGGTAVSNTAGTITSSVSANTDAGFSVVTYTGTGANATVGHGLGVAPSMIIVKQRSAVQSWPVYHASNGAANVVYLDLTNPIASSTAWQSTAPAATVFSIGTSAATNTNAATYVAYCWAPVAGYSAFGSYTGNGSADGPFIYTGFRPRWLMVKATTAATAYSWVVLDSSRNTYNLADFKLLPNSSVVENDAGAIGGAGVNAFDLVSNGFKSRTSNLSTNDSGTTYIYAAYAENPLRYSNAR